MSSTWFSMKKSSLIAYVLSALVFGLSTIALAAEKSSSPATPAFDADWFIAPAAEQVIGGTSNAVVVLQPNEPLVRRVCLNVGDVMEASLTFAVQPAPANRADVVAEGLAKDGQILRFKDVTAAGSITLDETATLSLVIWRNQWHQAGGGVISELSIERVGDGKRVTLPTFVDEPGASTELGTFALAGYAKRNRLPVIEKRSDAEPDNKAGKWKFAGAEGVAVSSTEAGLTFFTRGQATFGEQWETAPALTFTPRMAGEYRVSGSIKFNSGPPSDKIQPAAMRWMLLSSSGTANAKPSPGVLRVHRALRPLAVDAQPVPGIDYEPQPLASAELHQLAVGKRQLVEVKGFADVLNGWIADNATAPNGIVLTVEPANSGDPRPRVLVTAKDVAPKLSVRDHPATQLFENRLRPRDGVFTKLRDGRLYYGEDRLRLWGVVGYPDIGRVQNMGFNAQRVWKPSSKDMYDHASAKRGELKPYVKGDNSNWDKADRHLAALRHAGMFVQLAALVDTMPLDPLLADDSFIAGGEDWAEWKAAMTTKARDDVRGWIFLDERLQRVRKQHAKNLLTWVNPYTGKPYCQEESIAVYEIFNENGGVKRMLEGSFAKWPAYFQQKFHRRWNDWLRTKYKDDAALRTAWGKVNDDESLERHSVAAAPTFDQRNDFPKQRAADFVHFVIDLVDGFHQDFRAYCRTLAPSGVGVNVAPFSFDTQYRPSTAWSYVQGRGDVNCPGMYFWDLQSTLDKPPAAYLIDSHTVDSAATILYETNAARPGPFRAEYPLKLAALAGWQDWDGVFWHYWSSGGGAVDEAYLAKPMLYTTVSHYWNAVHHETDPAMAAAMAMAGRAFLSGAIRPAPKPAIIDVGANALFSYDAHNGINQSRRTFAQGSRLKFHPDKPGGVTLVGQPLPPATRIEGAVMGGEQIRWDWPAGRLIVDTPTMKGYAGRISGPYKFSDGIVLGEVGTPFVSFYMVSADGKPLTGPDASRRVYVSGIADAKNTGFDFDYGVSGGPIEQAKAIRNHGHAPVIVDRVPFAVWFPTTIDAQWNLVDFALRSRPPRSVSRTNKLVHDGSEMFVGVLQISARGALAPTPEPMPITAAATRAVGSDANATSTAKDVRWHPLAVLDWGQNFAGAHKALRDSDLVFTSISGAADDDKPIVLSDAQVPTLWSAAADIELSFVSGRMAKVGVTFKQPPPLATVIADYEKQFGPAAEKKIASQFETSVARWPAAADRPSVYVTESQGVLKILYEVER